MPIPIHELIDEHIEATGVPVAEVARRVGKSRAWLTKILHGERRIAADMIDEVLKAAEVDLHVFWRAYLESLGSARPLQEVLDNQSPELLLRAIRQGRSARSETLEAVASSTFPALLPEGQYEIDPRAEEIDSLRESNPAYALAEAEHWVRELHLQGLSKRMDASDTVQMATRLGVWGSALRVRGQTHLAAQALELALKLHGKATASATYADLLERSAFILKGFGYLTVAVGMTQRAVGIFSTLHDERRRARSILALGILHFYRGEDDLAEFYFSSMLKIRDTASIQRAAATVNLAVIYEKKKCWGKAIATLEEFVGFEASTPPVWVCLSRGLLGRILAQSGSLEEGAERFRSCKHLRRNHLSPEKSFLFFLDFATVLIELGQLEELKNEAREQAEMLALLENTPISKRVAEAFLVSVAVGKSLDQSLVRDVASRFSEALKRDRER